MKIDKNFKIFVKKKIYIFKKIELKEVNRDYIESLSFARYLNKKKKYTIRLQKKYLQNIEKKKRSFILGFFNKKNILGTMGCQLHKKIMVGNVPVGGDSPISVQSMTNTLTTDIKGTTKQINEIIKAGADLVRVSCPDEDSTKALKKITKNVNIPVIADIHFHYKRAIEAAESGADCLRLNPGNIRDEKKIKEVPIIFTDRTVGESKCQKKL